MRISLCVSTVVIGALALAPPAGIHAQTNPSGLTQTEQASGTSSLLQAVSIVDASHVWVSGHDGVVLRTEDGGQRWTSVATPAGDSLQFRDIHGFDSRSAVILSAGTGPASRIYRTSNGGADWELAFLMDEAEGFLDCMDFWDERGFAYGDEVDGVPYVLVTDDGGRSWSRPERTAMPDAIDGEGGFAASGTCARAGSDGRGWIATGASGAARVLMTQDYGHSWTAAEAPVVRGDAAGLTTISFGMDDQGGVAYGGDLANMDGRTANAARSEDGGQSWEVATGPSFMGPVYGSDLVGGTGVVVVGPAGADYSNDGGRTWMEINRLSWWAAGSAGPDATWLVGPDGRITKLSRP